MLLLFSVVIFVVVVVDGGGAGGATAVCGVFPRWEHNGYNHCASLLIFQCMCVHERISVYARTILYFLAFVFMSSSVYEYIRFMYTLYIFKYMQIRKC